MKNQRGFSFIELLIALTLLVISVGVGSITINTLYARQAKRCLTSMKSGLSETRIIALSKDREGSVNSMRVYKGTDGYYMEIPGKTPEIICDATVTLEYVVFRNGSEVKQTVDEPGVIFTFNRSSGALNKLQSSGAEVNGTDVYYYFESSSGMRTYRLGIYPDTGKFYTE